MIGFTDINEQKDYVTAKKVSWTAKGGSLKERREKKAESKDSNPWAGKLSNDTEMVDEDDLLNEEAKNGGEIKTFAKESDCLTKAKACDNCNCGRKELEEGIEMSEERRKELESGNVKSSCGKCYLGDAFRCATCPYLGQPAFEPGDKVKLKGTDQSKINHEVEQISTKTQGTKVVLDL
jgi:hypothetical protein